MRKIGITGGIASGKSLVADILSKMLDCTRIDADAICRGLLEPQAAGWRELSGIFGGKYITESGQIDRKMLRKDLFVDKELRRKVNRIIHPLAQKEISALMERIISSDSRSRVLVEVPLLFEAGWENLFDTIIVVTADDETRIARLMARDEADRETAVKEMSSQLPMSEKLERADHVIDNSGTLAATAKQVEQLAKYLQGGSSDNTSS